MPIGENPESRFGPPNDFKTRYRVIETQAYQPNVDIGEQAQRRFKLTSKKAYRYVRPFLRILYRFYSEMVHYPDNGRNWKTSAIKAADKFLETEKVNAIISSSSPVTCHIIAKELKNKHSLPWVADLRDLWTQNHAYPYSILRRMIERRLELKTLKHADALVTTSLLWSEELKELHKISEVYSITNGFDPERLNEQPINLTSKFTITYTGQIYTGKQNPSKLLAALRDLIDDSIIEQEDVEVRFYGPPDELLAGEIEKYRLSSIVQKYGVVPRQIAFRKQKESQLLLVFNWEGPSEKGVYTLKVFEYLASRRPILATGGFGNDVIEALLKETRAGVYCRTVGDIKSALKVLYLEYKQNGKTTYTGDIEKINKYSYREMARQFAAVLDKSIPAQ